MTDIVFPANEAERLQALYEYHILDTPEENDFNELVNLASEICQTPIAHISLIDNNRQWMKAKKGLDKNEDSRGIAFCQYTILDDHIMEVQDARLDARFENNPLVLRDPKIRFYAGISLKSQQGFNIGTLCVIDTIPRHLTDFQRTALSVISRQVMAQMELRKKNNELLELVRQTQEYNIYQQQVSLMQSRMLSIVSHDLRNPITSLKALVNLLQSNALSPSEISTLSDMLDESLSSVEALLANLIDWARKQFENQTKILESVSITSVTDEVIKLMAFTAQQKNIRLVNDTHNMVVSGDKDMLRFIIRNLVSNAIKYTVNGEIVISTLIQNNNITISVSDTGLGMSEELLEKLFRWNNRQSKAGTSGEKGTGLGLLLCQDFAKKMNSFITVESVLGKGSRFYFTVPGIQ